MLNDTIDQITEFVKDRSEQAQARIEKLETESRKRFQDLLRRGRDQGEETRAKLEEVLEAVKDVDVRDQVQGLRTEAIDAFAVTFGLVPKEEAERLQAEVDRLEAALKRAKAKRTTTARKRTTRKASPAKKASTSKKKATKKTTKKASPKKAAAATAS